MDDFGHRVRAARIARNMTQVELADVAGLDGKTVANIEDGRPARASVRARLEAALGMAGADLEVVIFNVLADHTSDVDWLDEVGAKLAQALRESGLLR